jgi:uncharacterized membrane protein HdeD (DUF308 family)
MISSTNAEIEPNASGSRAAMVAGLSIAVLGFFAVVFPFVTGLSVAILLGAIALQASGEAPSLLGTQHDRSLREWNRA